MATAVVTLRDVADLAASGWTAIELTLSVRSARCRTTPLHLGLAAELALGAHLAGPPASPRRRTTPSWSTIVLTVLFSSRISPCASTVIFCDRSPRATAVATWAMLRTWPVRLDAMKLTLSVRSRQVPATPRTWA